VFRALQEMGFTSSELREFEGTRISPRSVLEELLNRTLPAEGEDVILLRVDCTGIVDEEETLVRYQLIDYADSDTGLSAMMRCTSLPATAIARMIGEGTISQRGTQQQELVVPPGRLQQELSQRNVIVERTISRGT
jgi:lysine 6-dehydrogenase